MNTGAHIFAMLAILWLSVWCFETLNQRALGVAALGVFLIFIPLTFFAAIEDWHIFAGDKKADEEED
ncbi:MAG: hypothetical protein ACREBU_00075 [Nitrososphaera sp.]